MQEEMEPFIFTQCVPSTELDRLGFDNTTEFLFWKEDELELLEVTFPEIERELLEEVFEEHAYDRNTVVEVIRARVDVATSLRSPRNIDGEFSCTYEEMKLESTPSEDWVFVQEERYEASKQQTNSEPWYTVFSFRR